ncbi:hypothetical protein E2C01_052719 [Portunus trituberculatus]|uniref:Uncharacterized protein n=1 Tax=Portunus trituberculatus TaxID=210409 RepID=A0A5B7GFD9_PORTR|nr:hypothetical protein [Portunus trituberculatus]
MCDRHSFLSLYLARDVSTGIFFSVDSYGTPKEENHALLQHRHGRKISWWLTIYIHFPPRRQLVDTFQSLRVTLSD